MIQDNGIHQMQKTAIIYLNSISIVCNRCISDNKINAVFRCVTASIGNNRPFRVAGQGRIDDGQETGIRFIVDTNPAVQNCAVNQTDSPVVFNCNSIGCLNIGIASTLPAAVSK